MLYKYGIHICKYGHRKAEDFAVLNLWLWKPNSVCSLVDFVRKQVGESRAGWDTYEQSSFMLKSVMKGRGLLFAPTAVCREFSNGDQRLLGEKHQDKRNILLGSSLAAAQASSSSGSADGQCQLPPLLSLQLMILLILSSRWKSLGSRKGKNSCTVHL